MYLLIHQVLSKDQGIDVLKYVAESKYTPKFEYFWDVGWVSTWQVLEGIEDRKVEGEYLAE